MQPADMLKAFSRLLGRPVAIVYYAVTVGNKAVVSHGKYNVSDTGAAEAVHSDMN